MDRKKTILIAVLINAGLLVLLFVVAIHHEEPASKGVEVAAPASTSETKPLFNDAPLLAESPLAQGAADVARPDGSLASNASAPLASAPLSPAPLAPSGKAEIVHQLPPLSPQEAAAPIQPVTVPVAAPALAPQLLEVKVKRGDSLEKIAKAHRITVDEIIRINQLPSTFLRIGQVLKLPAEHATHASKAKSIAVDHSVSAAPSGQPEYYTVKVGDNPWTIAMKHHMKVDELLKINNISEEKARRLKAGDRMRIR